MINPILITIKVDPEIELKINLNNLNNIISIKDNIIETENTIKSERSILSLSELSRRSFLIIITITPNVIERNHESTY